MTKTQLESYRSQLLELSSGIQEAVSEFSEEVERPTGGQADGGLSNTPMHLADLGTDAYLQELSSTLLESEQNLGRDVDAALRRIDAGTYGTCEQCGTPIPDARLEALPYTQYCVKCAETAPSHPSPNLNRGRPQGAHEITSSRVGITRR